MSSWADVARQYMGWDRREPKQRVLITGGAGFIGSHLADLHLARGDSVYIVDDLSTGCRENISQHAENPNLKFAEADVAEWADLHEALTWADRAYHLAAVVGVKRVLANPLRALDVNLDGTRRLLEVASTAKWRPRVLIASSSEIYGFNAENTFGEDSDLVFHAHDYGRWSYAAAKLADEYYAMAFHDQRHLDVTAVRIFNTIGPRQRGAYGMVIPNFVHQAVAAKPLVVCGDGTQTRSFCDVRDLVRALD